MISSSRESNWSILRALMRIFSFDLAADRRMSFEHLGVVTVEKSNMSNLLSCGLPSVSYLNLGSVFILLTKNFI